MRNEKNANCIVTEEDVVTEAMLLLLVWFPMPIALFLTYAHAYSTAGSDTTANSTAAILFHILKNPRVYNTLREELLGLEAHEAPEAGDELALPSHDQVGAF